MKKQGIIILGLAVTLAGCSLDPAQSSRINADEEFAKLDSPHVETVEESLLSAAEAAMQVGEYKRAVSLYSQLSDGRKNDMRYMLRLAEATRRAGDTELAIKKYDLLLAKEPDNLDALEGKALAVMATGETVEAGRLLKQVLEKDGKRWRTLNALGILFAVKDMKDEALAYFNEAAKYSDQNPSVKNNIGLVQAMQGDETSATDTLQQAARHAQGEHRKHIELNLAMVYGISGQMMQARRIAERHLEGVALTNNLGLYAHLANDDELAKSYLNMALSGSSVYYERAWTNLNIITSEARSERDIAPNQKSIKVP